MLAAMVRPDFPLVRWGRRFAGMAALALLAGCATGRTVVDVPAPPASPRAAAIAEVLRIRSVSDDRVFEDAPRQPGVPSLGEPASALPASVRAHAVAQGDVVLSERADLCDVMRAQVAAALSQVGFRVEDDYQTALDVDVDVRKFWLWRESGVIRSSVVVDITIGGSRPVTVTAETSQPGTILSQDTWTNAVKVALDAWRKQADADLRAVPP